MPYAWTLFVADGSIEVEEQEESLRDHLGERCEISFVRETIELEGEMYVIVEIQIEDALDGCTRISCCRKGGGAPAMAIAVRQTRHSRQFLNWLMDHGGTAVRPLRLSNELVLAVADAIHDLSGARDARLVHTGSARALRRLEIHIARRDLMVSKPFCTRVGPSLRETTGIDVAKAAGLSVLLSKNAKVDADGVITMAPALSAVVLVPVLSMI